MSSPAFAAMPNAVAANCRWGRLRALLAASAFGVLALSAGTVQAQPEKCPRMVAERPKVRLAALDAAMLRLAEATGPVHLTFIGHASFLIESPAGVSIVTDYNDYVRANLVPRIVTMNHAHDTHYTDAPDPGIEYVLKGWGRDGAPAHHEVTVEDVWIRNVPTNIRRGAGTEYDGNSMFVFEVAGVCIAHLGHLHHLLTKDHLEALGRIDVVLAPVDGSYTLDLEGMVEVLKSINAPLVIPMHYFSQYGLERFLARLGQEWTVQRATEPFVLLSRETLPKTRTVLVLPGR
ncbi:MBL fold metallo-hydrolase [Xanthobacter aminoxidans]|uniref:MBL fold metallo-hydrolase n=1 Tax=Xanthobacter aminoxidans TaxID=186280 RepID=UPI002022F0E4|nr:MBL fold metallo-hydrolase [Xanthobacter aminoxidans]MCL8383742.1 MBL fold metallo-hydrolase [Xanthobacter aminoxidans]